MGFSVGEQAFVDVYFPVGNTQWVAWFECVKPRQAMASRKTNRHHGTDVAAPLFTSTPTKTFLGREVGTRTVDSRLRAQTDSIWNGTKQKS